MSPIGVARPSDSQFDTRIGRIRCRRPKAPPATQNASEKSSEGAKHKEVRAAKIKFGQLFLRKIIKFVATMSYFKAKMHQNRFRLGLRPKPLWGSSALPTPSIV